VAKSLMRQTERLSLQAMGEVDTYQLKQDLGYYHISAAMALTTWHNPVTFKDHLDEATRLTSPDLQRRHLMIKIVRAQGELLDAKNTSVSLYHWVLQILQDYASVFPLQNYASSILAWRSIKKVQLIGEIKSLFGRYLLDSLTLAA
jgi:hypothetical protein